jgi:glutamate--cysteine ligase
VPTSRRHLGIPEVIAYLEEHVFGDRVSPGGRAVVAPSPRAVGLELEWLTATPDGERPPLGTLLGLLDAAGPLLPGRSRLTLEPGGQVELSSRPHSDVSRACEVAANDLYILETQATRVGVELVALGVDPIRRAHNLRTDAARYQAMVRYFARQWPLAIEMMTKTASVQVNLGYGGDAESFAQRWRLVHALGPTLVAAFANSPLCSGRPTGWRSWRWQTWTRIDPSRTRAVATNLDPLLAWSEYALDANVMMIRVDEETHQPLGEPFPFRRWLVEGHELGWPSIDDLAYHLTTLFPPVRPRGWFEVRYLDALPTPFWHVAASVLTVLLDDESTRVRALEAVVGTEDLWIDAAQLALAHPRLAVAARLVFALASERLEAHPTDSASAAVVATYREHWVERGRCPADDRLDRWRSSGELMPPAESPIPYASFDAIVP